MKKGKYSTFEEQIILKVLYYYVLCIFPLQVPLESE